MDRTGNSLGRDPNANETYMLQLSPSRWEPGGWKYTYAGQDEVFHNHPNKKNFQGHS